MNAASTLVKKNRNLDPKKFLLTIGKGRKAATFLSKQSIFVQGDAVGPVFYIREGTVRYSVTSKFGKEATLSMLSEGSFFRRRLPGRTAFARWLCDRNDGLQTPAN